jgi:hypothetical protein
VAREGPGAGGGARRAGVGGRGEARRAASKGATDLELARAFFPREEVAGVGGWVEVRRGRLLPLVSHRPVIYHSLRDCIRRAQRLGPAYYARSAAQPDYISLPSH